MGMAKPKNVDIGTSGGYRHVKWNQVLPFVLNVEDGRVVVDVGGSWIVKESAPLPGSYVSFKDGFYSMLDASCRGAKYRDCPYSRTLTEPLFDRLGKKLGVSIVKSSPTNMRYRMGKDGQFISYLEALDTLLERLSEKENAELRKDVLNYTHANYFNADSDKGLIRLMRDGNRRVKFKNKEGKTVEGVITLEVGRHAGIRFRLTPVETPWSSIEDVSPGEEKDLFERYIKQHLGLP